MVCLAISELTYPKSGLNLLNQLVFNEVHVNLPIDYELVKFGVYHQVCQV